MAVSAPHLTFGQFVSYKTARLPLETSQPMALPFVGPEIEVQYKSIRNTTIVTCRTVETQRFMFIAWIQFYWACTVRANENHGRRVS